MSWLCIAVVLAILGWMSWETYQTQVNKENAYALIILAVIVGVGIFVISTFMAT